MAEKKAVQTRNGHRLVIRSVSANVQEIYEKFRERLSELSVSYRAKLQSLKKTLEKQCKENYELDKIVAGKLSAEDIEKDIIERAEFQIVIEEVICLVQECLEYKAVQS